MRQIKTISELRKAIIEWAAQGITPYVRYSLGPAADKSERSRNHQTGEYEAGLAADNLLNPDGIWPAGDERYLRMQVASYASLLRTGIEGTYGWVLTGDLVGHGSDNEPLLRNITPLARLSDEMAEEVIRYGNRELDVRMSWRNHGHEAERELRERWDSLSLEERESILRERNWMISWAS